MPNPSSGSVAPIGDPSCAARGDGNVGGQWTQAISFPALGNHEYPDTSRTLTACASSGLPVSFALADNNNCALSEGQVSAENVPAVCTVIASQLELDSLSTGVCTVDGAPVDLEGSRQVAASIIVSLHSIGTCTLSMQLLGAAPSVANRVAAPRSYQVLAQHP